MICEFVQIFSGFILQIILYLCLFRIIWVTLRQFYCAVQGRGKQQTRRIGQTELLAEDDDLPRVFLDDSGDHEDLVVNEDAFNDDDDIWADIEDDAGAWEDSDEDFHDAQDKTLDGNDTKGGGERLNQTSDGNDSKGGGGRLNQSSDRNDSKGGGGRLNQTSDGNDSKGGGGRLNQTSDGNDSKGGGGRLNQSSDGNDSKGEDGQLNQSVDADDSKGGECRLKDTSNADDSKGWEDFDGDDDDEEEDKKEITKKEIDPFPPKKSWRVYQHYDDIVAECLEKKILFEDPEFPPNDESIAFSPERLDFLRGHVTWTRPPQITDEPEFFMDGDPQRFNMVIGGYIADHGLVSGIANMSLHPELIFKVAPPGQGFNYMYAGVFLFQFWHFGQWIHVVVDDRLPCEENKLLFAQSRNGKEFWFPLLEKAYAKLHGAYEALETVGVSEALVDLTGGIAELYEIRDYRDDDIFKILTRSNEMESLISSSTHDSEPRNRPDMFGLYPGLPYSVTNVTKILVNKPPEEEGCSFIELLIRLRNPWGKGVEWRGLWRDNGREWAWVSEEEKARIEFTQARDGEWWMAYSDFIQHFKIIEIVSLTPSSIEHSHKIPWETTFLHGEWVAGVSAGGMKYMHKNPQYRISLTAVDEHEGDGKCVASISIMQKYRRSMLKLGISLAPIGFQLYHLKENHMRIFPMPEWFFHSTNYALVHCAPTVARDVTLTVRIPPGTYLIIPFTEEHSTEAEFLVRVCASSLVKLSKNDRQIRLKAKKDIIMTDELFDQYAEKFDENGEEEISWKNLKVIMDYFGSSIPHFKGFSKETVRSAIAMVDGNMNGRIDKIEYQELCSMLQQYKVLFVGLDKNNTGYLPPFALTIVLESAGIVCNDTILNTIIHRYGKEDGSISFDDYFLCLIKMTSLITKFRDKTLEKTKVAKFNLDDWLQANIFT